MKHILRSLLSAAVALCTVPVTGMEEADPPVLPTVCEIDLGMPIQHARGSLVLLNGKRHLLLKHANSPRIDPCQEYFDYPTDTYKLTLIDLGAKKVLWTRDLGRGIVTGDWFCPVLSFDVDGDGDDEIFYMANDRPFAPLSIKRSLVGLRAKDGKEFMRFPVKVTLSTPSETYRFVLMGGKNKKGEPVLVVQNGTYGFMDFFAYDKNGKSVWKRSIREDGTPRASHCSNVFDFNGDGADEILWGERMISIDNGKDLCIGNEDGWDAHSDIVLPVFDRNGKFDGVWTCRESRPTPGRAQEQFRCNYYDQKLRRCQGVFRTGHMDFGGVFRRNPEGDKILWTKPIPPKFQKDRAELACHYFNMKGEELDLPLWKVKEPRGIDLDGDGAHEVLCRHILMDLKGKRLYSIPDRKKWVLIAHIMDDLPGEQIVTFTADGKLRILADPNAKWSEAAKKRYAHPYYNNCLHNSSVGYNWAYGLGGI